MDSPESNADSDKPFVDCTDFLVLANHDMEYSAVRLVRIRAAGRYFVERRFDAGYHLNG